MDNIFSLDACSGPRCSTCIILDLLEDQNLKFRLAEKSTEDAVNVVKNAFQTNSCAVV